MAYFWHKNGTMESACNSSGKWNMLSPKKEWAKPVFEIISKDIVRSGAVAGLEGGTASDLSKSS